MSTEKHISLDDLIEHGGANKLVAVPKESEPTTEVGRLTTIQLITTLAQMGSNIQNVVELYQRLPNSTPVNVSDILKDIIANCEAVSKKAARLLAANK